MDKKRNPILVIIFTIISFGIYYLYWTGKVQAGLKERTGEGLGMGGHIAAMLFTFGIYNLIWQYKCGKRLHKAGAPKDNSVLYLLLCFLCGIGCLVNQFLQCNDINLILDKGSNA